MIPLVYWKFKLPSHFQFHLIEVHFFPILSPWKRTEKSGVWTPLRFSCFSNWKSQSNSFFFSQSEATWELVLRLRRDKDEEQQET